jgi:uncharacterized membrane protein
MIGKKLLFKAKVLSKKLSVRASAFGLFGIFAALAAASLAEFVPTAWAELLGNNAVYDILKIIASSMLAVVTFSLSTMVAAYASASNGVTPRAAKILMEDHRSQNALSTFLGAFIFSVVALAALSTGYYGDKGRFILFVLTVVIIVTIVWTIIRWIGQLSSLGRVHETIARIERATMEALRAQAISPYSGCRPFRGPSDDLIQLPSRRVGYVQAIDFPKLNSLAENLEQPVVVLAQAGSFLQGCRPLLSYGKSLKAIDEGLANELRSCFITGDARTFEEDPRFGFIVLSEVASRALSPAVNDPGTAIDVIGSLIRLFTDWSELRSSCQPKIEYPNLHLEEISVSDMMEDAFRPIARDGSGHIEVVIRLYKGLKALTEMSSPSFAESASQQKDDLVARARTTLCFANDLACLENLAKR